MGTTSHYTNAHDFSIGTQNITTNHNIGPPKTLFEHLEPHVAHGAAHDSEGRRDAPACHQETRVAILAHVVGWLKHGEGGGEAEAEDEAEDGEEDGEGKGKPRKIMWLCGPAGGGKSAIAGSVAKKCEDEGLLAAAFFFSSLSPFAERRYSRGLIATLVHYMSQHEKLQSFRQQLLLALEDRPDIFQKQLKQQAEHLILRPFRKIREEENREGWPKAVIVDGVDEVISRQGSESTKQNVQQVSEEDQTEVLDVLLALCRSHDFPFRILVTSRPEKNITDFFADRKCSIISLFLDSKYHPDADIERFLWSKFAKIRRRYHISDPWPGRSVVDHIVGMSSGQFVVPATVIRWIESGSAQQQMKAVLNLRQGKLGPKNPFEPLDALYHHILERSSDPKLTIKWVLSITSPMGLYAEDETPAMFWRRFLEDYQGEFGHRMAPLSSLVSIPPFGDDNSPIRIYHRSLFDYLSCNGRCQGQHVAREEVCSFIAQRIVVVLKNKGPAVPPSTPERRDEFLREFMRMKSLAHQAGFGTSNTDEFVKSPFLSHVTDGDLDALSECDPAWWARHYLKGESTALPFLWAIYFGVHEASKCGRRTGLDSQDEQNSRCHPACVRWREGILTGAKQQNWCTHRLENFPLDDLQGVTKSQARRILGPNACRACPICNGGGEWVLSEGELRGLHRSGLADCTDKDSNEA